ncbi:hypothetical protein [Parapedobacter lycopersici]|uniref:hypothetical protein n=1 Tax=Parapedobacter lycopersici TaxID=1864939 RepID=UPI00214DDFC2|nr:hypothetical protein [Parapedobacter lycopersici]
MCKAIVITPVKDSIENTLETIKAIYASQTSIKHLVYNDFSTAETKHTLEENQALYGYELIHLEDLTDTPSPNYKLVLQDAQRRALEAGLPLIVVESDVEVQGATFTELLDFLSQHTSIGLLGAITVGREGEINFPYLKFRRYTNHRGYIDTRKSLSFCCTLMSVELLRRYDFGLLKPSKDWFDTFISKQSLALGFKNIVLTGTRVLHKPHGSRPWKQLKYSNPIKYYFFKFIKRRDKI